MKAAKINTTVIKIKIVILILALCTSASIKADSLSNCKKALMEDLKHYKLYDFSNPLVSSGTGFQNMGLYDSCLRTEGSKYAVLNLIMNVTEPIKDTVYAFMGLCLPEQCVNREVEEYIREFIGNKTDLISPENILLIDSVKENDNIKQFDLFSIIVAAGLSSYLILFIIFNLVDNYCLSYKRRLLGENLRAGSNTHFKTYSQTNITPAMQTGDPSSQAILLNHSNTQNYNPSTFSYSYPAYSYSNSSLSNKGDYMISETESSFFTCFNIHLNYEKLCGQKQNSLSNEDEGVYMYSGLVFFGTAIFIVNQLVILLFTVPVRNPEEVFDRFQSFLWQFIFNADYSSDLFLSFGGFIIAYRYLRGRIGRSLNTHCRKQADFKKSIFFIFYKFFSTWPVLVAVLLFYWRIFPLLVDGPLGGHYLSKQFDSCAIQWPYIISFIANFTFTKYEQMYSSVCFCWSWYIYNDFQYAFIGLILLYIYLRKRSVFIILFVVMIISLLSVEGWIVLNYTLAVNVYELNLNMDYYKYYYSNFATRSMAFFIGYLFGIFYAEYRRHEETHKYSSLRSFFDGIRLNPILSFIIYLIGLTIMLFSVFITSWSYEENTWSDNVKICYTFLNKKIFTIGTIMFLLPLMLGNHYFFGGWFSCQPLIILSRLRFCALIVCGLVVRFFIFNRRDNYYFNPHFNIIVGLSFIIISYFIGFFIYLIIEAPFTNLCIYTKMKMGNWKKLRNQRQGESNTYTLY